MVQKFHQLRLVLYPSIYKFFNAFQVMQDFFHQQYIKYTNRIPKSYRL